MTEEQNNPVIPESSVDLTAGLSDVSTKIEELTEELTKEDVVIVDGKEVPTSEIMVEILNELKPDEEQLKVQSQNVETQQEAMDLMLEKLGEIVTNNERYHTEKQELMIKQQEITVEGFFFVGLSIVISFAVYMFWNQLSKW